MFGWRATAVEWIGARPTAHVLNPMKAVRPVATPMKRLLAATALCLLPSCALLTAPIDRMVERQEISLAAWEARQIEAQTDATLTVEERLEAQKVAWADYRRESTENLSQGLTEFKGAIETIAEAGTGAVVSGAGGLGLTLMEKVLASITALTTAAGGAYAVHKSAVNGAATKVNADRDLARARRGEPTT